MRDEDNIVRDRQLLIRREMMRRGISITAVQFDGGWNHPSTPTSYFPNPDGVKEPATMSVAALFRLIDRKALPLELLSMLLPDGVRLIAVPEEVDHNELCGVMHEYLEVKAAAHHPDSPDKEAISECEDANLKAALTPLTVVGGGK